MSTSNNLHQSTDTAPDSQIKKKAPWKLMLQETGQSGGNLPRQMQPSRIQSPHIRAGVTLSLSMLQEQKWHGRAWSWIWI
jgi:hypothetical protein